MPEDFANLERCLACKHSRDRNAEKGTLTCQRYSMLIDNQADEIPDDCVEFQPEEATANSAEAKGADTSDPLKPE